jgi:HAD superfamily hydrolase (TIGR01509 family)
MMRARATRPFDEDAMHARRRDRYNELLRKETVRPGVVAWLDEATELGFGIAIASSSESEWVEPLLESLGLHRRFQHIVCFGDGVAAKPEPDTYRAACAALGVAPDAAIAIEDSPHGVAAAKTAGLWCVAVPHAITEQLDLTNADLVLPSLADASLRDVLRIRAGTNP